MFTDILFIVITAFALFGLYCLAETISDTAYASKFPPSVIIVNNSSDEATFKKIKYVQENIPNNHIIVFPFEENAPAHQSYGNFEEYLKDVLCVNNK